jgi:hypothetical protein
MESDDVGCHAAALCAQAVEKAIKGYLLLNSVTPALNHRPDRYLPALLNGSLLRHKEHRGRVSKLFDARAKHAVQTLLKLTPGGAGTRTDLPNTEYPWTEGRHWKHYPAGAAEFARDARLAEWLRVARQVQQTLHKLWSAVDRGPGR